MLIIDSNQYSMEEQARKKGKESLLDYFKNEVIEVESLETGDIMFFTHDDKMVGIELKIYPQDFYASIRDNRLIKQMIRLVNDYEYKYIVCIGKMLEVDWTTGNVKTDREVSERGFNLASKTRRDKNRNRGSNYKFHYINAHFLSRFESQGGHIRWFQDKRYTAAFILSLNRLFSKPRESVEFVKPKLDLAQVGWSHIDNSFALTLSTFGLSPKVSIEVSKLVKSVDELIKLNPNQLAEMKVVNGKKLGNKKGLELFMKLRGK